MDYFEFSVRDKMIYAKGSTEYPYRLYQWVDSKTPESELYIVYDLKTDSLLLKDGKFYIALGYPHPPKSKWSRKAFYVYCEELKNDLYQLGIK